jgi:phenylacetate-CoA ligase
MLNAPAPNLTPEEALDSGGLAVLQRDKLAGMWRAVLPANAFYRRKFEGLDFDPRRDPIHALPLTTRAELEQAQLEYPPYGTNLTYPLEKYCRFHQTSGSGGRPLRWLDTVESWAWFRGCWQTIFRAAGAHAADRALFPFSFGPFIGFWAAFEAAHAMGLLALPAGGLSTPARLRMLLDNQATLVCCTPTYALRMAEVAAEQNIDLARSSVRALIVAGEPGGSIPAVRSKIESAWGARVHDHSGMTEMGAVSFECIPSPGGLHVNEAEFIAEVIDPETLQPLPEGSASTGELVLTNLGRWGSPLIRYRTGDQVQLVRPERPCACGRWFARLEGGILGRIDDMFIVRGNNVFPTAVEAVIRGFAEVAEFRVTVVEGTRDGAALTQVQLEIEPVAGTGQPVASSLAARVSSAVQQALSFRAEVIQVQPGTLPRFELKAKRFVRRRVDSESANPTAGDGRAG